VQSSGFKPVELRDTMAQGRSDEITLGADASAGTKATCVRHFDDVF